MPHDLPAKSRPELGHFDWDDPFLLDAQLTEDERMVRDAARAYARTSSRRACSRPSARRDRPRDLPRDGRARPARPDHPRGVRRAGGSYVCYGLIAREVERVDSGYRSMMSVQSSLVMYPIYAFGTEAQQRKVPAQARHRRVDRLLRPHRAGPRLRSRRHGDARQEGGRRLPAHRQQDVDHQLADRRRLRGLGEGRRRRRDPRLHPREGHARA